MSWRRQSVLKRCYFACAAIFFVCLVAGRHMTSPPTKKARKGASEPVRAAVVVGLKRFNTTEGPRWYVLMEQRQVKNWLRSSRNYTALMAWPGEYAFPGGAMEPTDVNMEETAKRELQEELLGVQIPQNDFNVRLFDVITVQGYRRIYSVHIYIAFESVNRWLATLEVQHLNANLGRRNREFEYLLNTGEFWKLSPHGKMYVSPEVHHFEWMALRHAFYMATSPNIKYVNEFQKKEFQRHQVDRREPVGEQMIEVLENLLTELEPPSGKEVVI